jgi:hypothetical protein
MGAAVSLLPGGLRAQTFPDGPMIPAPNWFWIAELLNFSIMDA